MLFGSNLSFTTFVLVVVVVQVSTLHIFRFALRLGFRFIAESVKHITTSLRPATLSQKRAVFPAFSSRDVTLCHMRKIGIHFIIYHRFAR